MRNQSTPAPSPPSAYEAIARRDVAAANAARDKANAAIDMRSSPDSAFKTPQDGVMKSDRTMKHDIVAELQTSGTRLRNGVDWIANSNNPTEAEARARGDAMKERFSTDQSAGAEQYRMDVDQAIAQKHYESSLGKTVDQAFRTILHPVAGE